MTAANSGYVDYFEVLGLEPGAKPGEVRKEYRRRMKDLVAEIARVEITPERRGRYLLEIAKLNAALCVLRDQDERDRYWETRQNLMALEEEYRQADASGSQETDLLRRRYDAQLRDFLSKYVEEAMLLAGRDKEAVEASHWDSAHERHASRLLREYRHMLFQEILERLPYAEVTRPEVDWNERSRAVAALLAGKRS